MKINFTRFSNSMLWSVLLLSGPAAFSQTNIGLDWVKQAGASYANSVTTDQYSNVYVTGNFEQTVDFDPNHPDARRTAAGQTDIFITKTDPAGNLIWVKTMGGSGYDIGNAITVTVSGHIYVTGSYGSKADFNPAPGVADTFFLNAAGGSDIFVCKLDTAGNFVWARSMGGNGSDAGLAITTDASGNVLTTGRFTHTADFNPDPATSYTFTAAGNPSLIPVPTDIFISKLDDQGNYVWARQIGGSESDQANGITTDPSGNVYIAGGFRSTTDFDPGSATHNVTATGGEDAFVLKLNASGDYVWASTWGANNRDRCTDIVVDATGNVYTTGTFTGIVDFDPGTGTDNISAYPNIFEDIFVSKLDASGNYLWARGVGGTGIDIATSIALDAAGDVYTCGYFQSMVDFNPAPGISDTFFLESGGFSDVYVWKLTSGGDFAWAKSFTGAGFDYGYGIAVSQGNIYTVGMFDGTVDFDPGNQVHTLTTAGSGTEIFVHKMFCVDTTVTTLHIESCSGSYTFHGETYTESGSYTLRIPNTSGCDSLTYLNLQISYIPEPQISPVGFLLKTSPEYSGYQWLLNGNPIPGATDSFYNVEENGRYQVAVTEQEGCTDTSRVYEINNVSVSDPVPGENVIIYPNPVKDRIYLQAPFPLHATLSSMDGRILRAEEGVHTLDMSGYLPGIYMLHVSDEKGIPLKTIRVLYTGGAR